jgi:hypothetical protein
VSTGQSERRLGVDRPISEGRVPAAAPTRKTLVFPAIDVPRSRRGTPPPVPTARASERPTLKTLPPVAEAAAGTSNTQVIELSASALDSVPSNRELDRGVDLLLARSSTPPRPWRVGLSRLRGSTWRQAALGVVGLIVVVAIVPGGSGAVTEIVTGVSEGLHGPGREPHEAAGQHTPLALRAFEEIAGPTGGCATSGASRVLATRAHLPPGLDVNVVDGGGFGVGFAASVDEALGLRLDGSPLRVADRVRVRSRTGAGVRHVAVDAARHDDDALDLRVDADDARTVVPEGDAPAFRLAVVGGWISVTSSGKGGRGLWPVPAGAGAAAGASAGPGAGAGARPSVVPANPGAAAKVAAKAKASADAKAKGDAILGAMASAKAKTDASKPTRTSDGFVRLGASPARSINVATAVVPAPDLRAAAREDGGAVIAVRRPSALWLGLVDAHLAAEGSLVALARAGAALGMPSVAPFGTGGAVAWAEKPAGEREWIVMIASFQGGADSARSAPTLRPVGAGMSPSLALLPDGDLLLAYAVGASGSHRVVVRRLGRDLEPRGDAVVVSPDEINAGQPAAAVASDGRALVAFFGAERGRPSSVLATPLACGL